MTAATLAEALAEFQASPPTLTKNKAGHQSKYADLVQVNAQVLARLNEAVSGCGRFSSSVWTCTSIS